MQPTCKTKAYGERAFSVYATKIWSTVPLEIRRSSTILLFTKKLKTFLLTKFIKSNSLSYFKHFFRFQFFTYFAGVFFVLVFKFLRVKVIITVMFPCTSDTTKWLIKDLHI